MSNNTKLSMKNDFVFKKLFSTKGSEESLKDFLSNLLELDIKEIEVEHDVYLARKIKEEKYGILDVKATLNEGIEVNIEVQVEDKKNTVLRTIYYLSKLASSKLKLGEVYNKLKPVYVVMILDYEFLTYDEHIIKTEMISKEDINKEIPNYLTCYYIELPKLRRKEIDLDNVVNQWLTFIDGENEDRIGEVMKKNEKIKETNKRLEVLSEDEETRELAEFRESAIREMASAEDYGFTKGKEEGEATGRIKIAKAMLKEGLDIDVIVKITNLSKEEIEKLK